MPRTGPTLSRSAVRRRVTFVVPSGPAAADVFGPLELLDFATSEVVEQGAPAGSGYDVEVVAAARTRRLGEIAGIRLEIGRDYRDVRGAIDTLIVPPIAPGQVLERDPSFLAWLRRAALRAERVVGLCTGTFLLAHAGLLEGKRATIHWALADEFRRTFPAVRLEPDRIYVREGKFWSSAGSSAILDLMLALVEEDFGPRVARAVARFLVLFLRRPGGQSQFSVQLSRQFAESEPLRELQGWIFDHLDQDLSVDALAEQAGMSPRNFRRVFRREIGATPGKYVEQARIEAARRLLEETKQGVDAVAAATGFGSAEHLRTVLVRELGVGPAAYRSRFSTTRRPAA